MIGLPHVLFVAAGLLATGMFAAGYTKDAGARLAAVPIALAGTGLAMAGVARFGSSAQAVFGGQELAILAALSALALVAIGVGLLGAREVRR